MADVCHKCPLWTQVRGKDPQSNEEIDDWGCALGWLPILLIENAQQVRQAGAATESFRNEMVRLAHATTGNGRLIDAPPVVLLQNGNT